MFPANWGQYTFPLMEVSTPQIIAAFNLCHLIPMWLTIWVAALKVGQIQIALFSKQQVGFLSWKGDTKHTHMCVMQIAYMRSIPSK